jgi:hypothetical protein
MSDLEGVAVNQLINVAIAEKLAQMRTGKWFADRIAAADPKAGAQLIRDLSRGGGQLSISVRVTLMTAAAVHSSPQPVSHFALPPSHSPRAQLDALRESPFCRRPPIKLRVTPMNGR